MVGKTEFSMFRNAEGLRKGGRGEKLQTAVPCSFQYGPLKCQDIG
jgi:hypothetical protein